MNIWNKVFLGLIFAMAIAVVVLASAEFHIRNTGLRTIKKLNEDIVKTDTDIARIAAGTKPMELSPDKSPSELGFDELRGHIREHSAERGRAWFGCIVAEFDGNKLRQSSPVAEVEIIVTSPFAPSEAGVPTDVVPPETLRGVVYVFREGAKDDLGDPGTFLGRFNVGNELKTRPFLDDEGNEKLGYRITLVSTDLINDDEVEQIFEACNSRWTIYTAPPVDRVAGIFDRLTEEEKQAIPEDMWAVFQPRPVPELAEEDIEYIRGLELEGLDVSDLDSRTSELLERAVEIVERDRNTMDTAWTQTRDKVIAIWKRYQAVMDDSEAELAQDFSAALDSLHKQRSRLYRNIQSAQSDIGMYETSGDKARAESEALKTQLIPLEEKRVANMEVQRNEVKSLLAQYNGETTGSRLRIEKLQALAEAYIAAITDIQVKAAEKIEERAKDLTQRQE